MKRINKFLEQSNWQNWIGKEIIKHSDKPFKSGSKTAIPLEITINEYSQKTAFKLDDGSVVDCHQCCLKN